MFMLYVTLERFTEGLRSPNHTWSSVRETVAEIRIPEYFSVSPDGNMCELHFKITLAYVAIDVLASLDKALRSYQFCHIDEFRLDFLTKSCGHDY